MPASVSDPCRYPPPHKRVGIGSATTQATETMRCQELVATQKSCSLFPVQSPDNDDGKANVNNEQSSISLRPDQAFALSVAAKCKASAGRDNEQRQTQQRGQTHFRRTSPIAITTPLSAGTKNNASNEDGVPLQSPRTGQWIHVARRQSKYPSARHTPNVPKHRPNARKKSNVEGQVRAQRRQKWITGSELKSFGNDPGNVPVPDPKVWGSDSDKNGWAPLADWSGAMAPPPEVWDARPAFENLQSARTIEAWLAEVDDDTDPLGLTKVQDAQSENFSFIVRSRGAEERPFAVHHYFAAPKGLPDHAKMIGDIVPQSWIPTTLEKVSPQEFWEDHLKCDPPPQDVEDLFDAQPFWEKFPSDTSTTPFHLELEQPECKGGPPDESVTERRLREADHGTCNANGEFLESAKSRADRISKPKMSSRLQAERIAARKTGSIAAHATRGLVQPESDVRTNKTLQRQVVACTSMKPKINMSIRGAVFKDIHQITNVYNHHISTSVVTPEMYDIPRTAMQARFDNITRSRLPFLVACVPSIHTKRNDGRSNNNIDRVIGFVHAEDYHDAQGLYRYTAKVSVFVHRNFLRKGVATCLMDTLLRLLDPQHVPRGGYDLLENELGSAPFRTLSRLMVNLPFCPKEDGKAWMARWFDSVGFEQKAELGDVGNKFGKSVSLAIYMRKLGPTVESVWGPVGKLP